MLRNLLLLAFLSLFFSGVPKPVATTLKVLYIGNSLTYVNDLPALVKEMAIHDGVDISYKSFLYPDYSLEDHWNDKKAGAEIRNGGYDFVIAQQGPSALPESQVLLLEYADKFAKLCKSSKSQLALYMVWPSKARSFDLDNVISSYTNAATKTSSVICPAGLAWKYAWEKDAGLPLYGADNFHPSIAGSVLAALTVYGTISNKRDFDFIRLNEISWRNEITADMFSVLNEAALKAINDGK